MLGSKTFYQIFPGLKNFFNFSKIPSALVPGIKNDYSLTIYPSFRRHLRKVLNEIYHTLLNWFDHFYYSFSYNSVLHFVLEDWFLLILLSIMLNVEKWAPLTKLVRTEAVVGRCFVKKVIDIVIVTVIGTVLKSEISKNTFLHNTSEPLLLCIKSKEPLANPFTTLIRFECAVKKILAALYNVNKTAN